MLNLVPNRWYDANGVYA
jgi:hypothetical protein